MLRLNFTKMHGLGNDFVVINNLSKNIDLTEKMIQQISDRHIGVGCDQVLVIEKSLEPDIDFVYKIYNQDGSISGQCGNGARCLAKFICDEKLSDKRKFVFKTLTSVLEVGVINDNCFRVNMGEPKKIEKFSHLDWEGTFVDMGNPHVVFLVDDVDDKNLNNLELNHINIGFMQIVSKEQIKLRVFERGAGETLACGSGACAAVVAGIHQGLLDQKVTVKLALGNLEIEWLGEKTPVWMTGPATTSFTGQIEMTNRQTK